MICREYPALHHIMLRSKRGSGTAGDIAGFRNICHTLVHTDAFAKENLAGRKDGYNKKYGSLSALSQIILSLFQMLRSLYPEKIYSVTGYQTKAFRNSFGIDKDHNRDVYYIACMTLKD